MSPRYRPALLAAAALLLGAFVAPASAAASTAASGPITAVAYQIGVSHDGYSGDTSIVPPLTHQWSRNFGGAVSYPLISGGAVFVTVANSGSTSGTKLYALTQSTGATIWSKPISGTYNWSNAAFDAGQVFVVNSDGLLKSFNATTGELDWSVQLPGQYLFSSPPTASNGVVYVGGAGDGGTLYAVSESSGQVLWTQPVANGDESSPALNGTSVFVSYACGLTYSFARTTGAQQWFHNGPCEGGGGKTPVVSGGSVYMRDPINGNEILNAKTGKQTGTFAAGPAPAFDGQVGLFLNQGTLTAVTDGTTQWSFAGDGGLDSAPIVVDSTVYVGSSSGELYGLAVSTGKQVWSTNVGSGIVAPNEQGGPPLTGLGAGQGLLVVPAGDRLAAYSG